MRVYLPSTLPALAAALAGGSVPPGTGFALTLGLREWYAGSDDEEMEYAALLLAARASLRLLDVDAAAPRRRVVVVVEVDDGAAHVRDDLERGAVRLDAAVPIARVRAGHVDEEAAAAAVAAAADVIVEADLGGEEAAFVVDTADGFELLWYATQELADLAGNAT